MCLRMKIVPAFLMYKILKQVPCHHPQVLRILADLFAKRVGPVMGVAAAAATKEAANNAAVSQ
eukprot:1161257-Pelagomonas_calceolata.AAC.3